MTERPEHPSPWLDVRWDRGPTVTVVDGTDTSPTVRLTPAETAALVKRLAAYLATWHRTDVDLTDTDPKTDPAWQPQDEHGE